MKLYTTNNNPQTCLWGVFFGTTFSWKSGLNEKWSQWGLCIILSTWDIVFGKTHCCWAFKSNYSRLWGSNFIQFTCIWVVAEISDRYLKTWANKNMFSQFRWIRHWKSLRLSNVHGIHFKVCMSRGIFCTRTTWTSILVLLIYISPVKTYTD